MGGRAKGEAAAGSRNLIRLQSDPLKLQPKINRVFKLSLVGARALTGLLSRPIGFPLVGSSVRRFVGSC
jgi:hypothetical protein